LANGALASDGYAALADYDSNGDGQITAADSIYGALRVWVDANSDGHSQADELHSLQQLSIASLSTRASAVRSEQQGNVIGLAASYTSTDGSEHASADVWFQTSTTSVSKLSNAPLSTQVSALGQALGQFRQEHSAAAAKLPVSPLAAASQALAGALQHYQQQAPLASSITAPGSHYEDSLRQSSTSWFSVPSR
ncbi:MAG: hypothetical protein K2P77_10155, partial [Burkholderiaceae bacterium]|nr:hypothetical protein [Burkholderiaceae bacterium]